MAILGNINVRFQGVKSGEPTTNHSSLVHLVATKHTSWEVDSNPPEPIVLNGGSGHSTYRGEINASCPFIFGHL